MLALLLAPAVSLAEVALPEADPAETIRISGSRASRWTEGAYEVWLVDRGCRITQGSYTAEGDQALLWIERSESPEPGFSRVLAYFEGNVAIDPGARGGRVRQTSPAWYHRFATSRSVDVQVAQVVAPPAVQPPLVDRAVARRRQPGSEREVVRAQYTAPDKPAARAGSQGTRRIRLFPRSNVPVQAEWFVDPITNQGIALIDSGVNLIVDGLGDVAVGPVTVDSIDISADRLVIWTENILERDQRGESFQAGNVPLEVYMEGNVVFRQGEAVIHADRMYYDVARRSGVVLQAELLTPVPDYEGVLRLRTEILQQLGPNRFFAQNAFLTASRMGRPGYRIQVESATLEDTATAALDPATGLPRVDEETGEVVVDHDYFVTSENNALFVGDVPILWWPRLATNLEEPSFFVRRVRFKNDSVFGTQILTDWDAYEILGLKNRPKGTDWDISADYLSERGIGHGTTFRYARDDFFKIPGPASGLADYWGIEDGGHDNLGFGRRDLDPEKDYRWRLFWQHRQRLPGDFQLSAEAGWISDRNFLEGYLEREWDEQKDQTTGIELKRTRDNISWSVSADARINDFMTQTGWLPRADHFWLGQELLGDRLTWYEHTSVGYAQFDATSRPEDPADAALFRWLPWESSGPADPLAVEGERFATRHELDLPLQAGPVKIVPYALGEFAHWGQNIYGDDVQRLYGQAGVRASIPFWRIDPAVRNDLLNLNGLAHKVVFDAELAFAESDQDLQQLPLYDPLDDDSIEAFRRRLAVTTFGGATPYRFDERSYALRSGLAGWVTSPSTEIADDLAVFRLGMRHRWQTKRGKPGEERIVDWITFDTHATLFPRSDNDNFGNVLGLVDYDLRWHVGDRVTLLSSGYFDFFDDGGKLVSFGGFLNRPERGSIYAGIHFLNGPIESTILSYSHTYRMNEKWVTTFGASMDISDNNNIGQSLTFTRIGESFLISAGLNVDASRDSLGVHLAIEPRFLPKSRLGRVGGASIPVAGAYGLE